MDVRTEFSHQLQNEAQSDAIRLRCVYWGAAGGEVDARTGIPGRIAELSGLRGDLFAAGAFPVRSAAGAGVLSTEVSVRSGMSSALLSVSGSRC